ncbi:MAG TPA: hypothetical protein DEB52_16995 [Hyphomonas sp.]|jgi:hypothetical protein|nr:hypothetical protein [Hyphomonas sp.]HBT37632.1 hypothetical protein [Hyphomonas sp.]|tara:strand:- start:4328 stop:4696 length:369 start_codon:yes stop_codon:yes gene_type:complete
MTNAIETHARTAYRAPRVQQSARIADHFASVALRAYERGDATRSLVLKASKAVRAADGTIHDERVAILRARSEADIAAEMDRFLEGHVAPQPFAALSDALHATDERLCAILRADTDKVHPLA